MEVFSVKLEEDLKTKIKTFISESGKEGNDFMDQVIKLYELNMAKDIMPSAMGDVEELQAVTKRIYDIFIGLIERSNSLMKDREGTLREEVEKKNKTITLVQDKLDKTSAELEAFRVENEDLNGKYKELREDVSTFESKMQEQERNHRELLNSKDDLILEYRGKNDTLSGIVAEYQTYKDKNMELISKLNEAWEEREGLKVQLVDQKRIEEKLNTEIERIKSQNEIEIMKLRMEKEKAILDLREVHQNRIEELNENYNQKVKELLDGREPSGQTEEKEPEKTTRKTTKKKS